MNSFGPVGASRFVLVATRPRPALLFFGRDVAGGAKKPRRGAGRRKHWLFQAGLFPNDPPGFGAGNHEPADTQDLSRAGAKSTTSVPQAPGNCSKTHPNWAGLAWLN